MKVPLSWMVHEGKSQSKMEDLEPVYGNPHMLIFLQILGEVGWPIPRSGTRDSFN